MPDASLPLEVRFAGLEAHVGAVQAQLHDPALAELYARCFMNTLDTTVRLLPDGDPFVITGDIPAMWLRDSTAQVWPYVRHARHDPALATLLAGLVRRQLACLRQDPYANAFNAEPSGAGHRTDQPEFSPWVWERKFEIDSLCYPLRLAHRLWQQGTELPVFGPDLRPALHDIVRVFRAEQHHSDSPYTFIRPNAPVPSDTLSHDGRGRPVGHTGLIWSGFRPSDDACQYGYNIPANMFAVVTLGHLADLAGALGDADLAGEAEVLRGEVEAALRRWGVVEHPTFGAVWAYEVDGLGAHLLMDDANVPSLLSAPYLGYGAPDDALYLNTRRLILSGANPSFAQGRYARGVGSPHTPEGYVWPIGIAMQGLTALDPGERRSLVGMLASTTAGTGWMHESFNPDDPAAFTRGWFAWANSLFAELVERLVSEP